MQAKLALHRPALTASLEEFHRVQCFFGIAIQIAALVVMSNGRLGVSSIGQAQLSYLFMQTVTTNSALSVAFTLWYLGSTKKREWYRYLLSACTYILSIAGCITATTSFRNPKIDFTGQTFPTCGNQSPVMQCPIELLGGELVAAYEADMPSKWVLPVAVPAVFMLYVSTDHLWFHWPHCFCSKHELANRCQMRLTATCKFVPLLKESLRIIWTILGFLQLIVALVLFAYQFSRLANIMDMGIVDTNNWGIGQIVGITVWLPPIFEFFRLETGKCPWSLLSMRVPWNDGD